ncbi:lysosome membrane protein 2-like [Ptychodera flava]|uniref:lysosome membrane protein 2-like n=1 Tax=Ptychodera flava TaxID=63121 RepID=UPI00396A081A
MAGAFAYCIVSSVIGVLLFGGGIGLIPLFHKIVHDMVVEQLVIDESSMTYDDWVSPGATIYMQFWFFDLVNPVEVMSGHLPYFAERGPYTYREHREKQNITWNNNGTVSYRNKMTYIFDPSMSVGTEDDVFTTINIPLLTITTFLEYSPNIVKWLADLLSRIVGEDLFIERSVKELLWGYEDPIFSFIHAITGDAFLPSGDFGLFMDKNNSDDGVYTVYTGEHDIDKLNSIENWNGRPNLTWWTTDEANMINGTDGTMNRPFADLSEKQYLFSSDICRSIFGEYEKDVHYEGIRLVRFTGPSYIFANGTEYPPNAGFCTPDIDHCLPGGLLNVSVCQQGAPVVFSLPHFLYADPRVLLPTMSPNKEEHETFVDADPITGITMRVAKRLQTNIHLKPSKYARQTSGVQEMFFPVMWLNESSELGDASVHEYKESVQTPIQIMDIAPYIVAGIGFIILVVTLIFAIRRYRKKRASRSLESSSVPESCTERTSLLHGEN